MQTRLIGPGDQIIASTVAAVYRVRGVLHATSPARLALVALGLGGAVDYLFYGKLWGVSVPLFTGLLLLTLVALGRHERVRPAWRNAWLVVPLGFFALMVAVRADGLLTMLNVGAVLGLLGLVCVYYAGGRISRLGLVGYPFALLEALATALFAPATLVPTGVDTRALRSEVWPRLLPVLRGALLAWPVLLVFTVLLASSDLVFAHTLVSLISLQVPWSIVDWGVQGLVVLGAGWLLAGGLVYALGRRYASDAPREVEMLLARVPRLVNLGMVEAATLLVLVDALFAVFSLIQATYLFGGQANITAAGYTYADYARRGFFELVIVAVLTLGLSLVLHHLTRRTTAREQRVFNGLTTGLVLLVGVLLAAALQRMMLYEATYGYTVLRLYVHLFMLWLGVVFGLFLVTLWTRPTRFALGLFVAALGFLASLNVINPAATIAEQNLALQAAGGQFDPYYLANLGTDAVPLLLDKLSTLPTEAQPIVRTNLARQLACLDDHAGWRAWPTWNLARQQAYAALVAHRASLFVENDRVFRASADCDIALAVLTR